VLRGYEGDMQESEEPSVANPMGLEDRPRDSAAYT
jgi:hypothetical protein